jgi:hypothetical protein
MTSHLTRAELDQFQYEERIQVLSSLVTQCRDRYLRSAALVELDSDAVERVRALTYEARVDLTPLIGPWVLLCERYRDIKYSPQIPLLPDRAVGEPMRWTNFVHQRLLPQLIQDDELVRNVLRVLGGLPCASRAEAAVAIRSYVANVFMEPDWVPGMTKEDVYS